MFKTYSAQETAAVIGIDRHMLPLLSELKMLEGIKTGKGRRYSEKEIEEFWETFKGSDISNAENIRMTATMWRMKKASRRD